MNFFSGTKIGLHFGNDYLSFAVLKPRGRRFLVQACKVIPLPPDSIRHSPLESNILNQEEIKDHLKNLLKDAPKGQSISLSIPDLSSRMVFTEVKKSVPALHELNQMIKWNMEQKFLSNIGDSQISHQIVAQSKESFKNTDSFDRTKTKHFLILGTAVLKNILSEYEALPLSIQMIPKVINNCSFHLFNLYHDLIFNQEKAGNFLFLNLVDHYFTLMVFEQKILRYIRTVGLRNPIAGSEAEKKEIEEKNNLKIFKEIESSLQYHYKDFPLKSQIHLFINGPENLPGFSVQLTDQFKMKVHLLNPSLLMSLEWAPGLKVRETALLTPAIAAAAGALI
ncbi:MAG: hypothetical protein HYR79_09025 [Nitrospirae bacterium]|nr:hypothetical protein [Nitrospirota bacterium]